MDKQRVAIFLTVRLKSTRLPKKALLPVADKTIIGHIIARAKKIKQATDIVLCTSTHPDDAPLIKIAQDNGIAYFCGSENNIIERFIGAAQQCHADLCVRVTGDNCLFSPEMVDYLITLQKEGGYDYVTTKELPGGAKGDVFTYKSLVKLSKLLQDENASEYLSWLLADETHFKVKWAEVPEQFRRPHYRLHCDTPKDYEFLQRVYKDLYNTKDIVDFTTLIRYLDENPEVAKMNAEINQISRADVQNTINLQLKSIITNK